MTGSLFPSADERLGWDHHLSARLLESERRIGQGPVTPAFDRDIFATELAQFDFARPMPFGDLLGWTLRQLETGVVHVNHPRYLGLFNPAPNYPAQCADRIAAALNPQLASATTSPAAVAIEAHLSKVLCGRVGLPADATGHFTSGGSEANYTALICALTEAVPGFAATGSRAFSGQPTIYISRDSHLGWIKFAHMAGIGRDAVRLVATDGTGRMDAGELNAAIVADRRRGCVPVMLAATAGTTNAGMIDPLAACGDSARRHRLWYHVDAAWGGGLIASERWRGLLAGIEAADSVTIDAHKWFAATMGCGIFLTARPQALSRAFAVAASYMPSRAEAVDPYLTTAQWSRRFLGLRLFLSLAAAGWAGHGAQVERAVALGESLAEMAKTRGWAVANEPKLAVVCLAPPPDGGAVADIVQRVLRAGRAWVSAARFEGRDVIRACITHAGTSLDDVEAVVDSITQMPAHAATIVTGGSAGAGRRDGVRNL